MQMQNLVKFYEFVPKIFGSNEIVTITKGRNCVVDLQKLTCNNPKLDLVNLNTYAKFGLIPSIRSQDIQVQ